MSVCNNQCTEEKRKNCSDHPEEKAKCNKKRFEATFNAPGFKGFNRM